MKKPEYPSSNGSHSSHPKLRLPFQWSTRRRLVTTIVIVFFMLTGVVTAMTYYVVNRQLETVTVNKSFTQAEDADEQHSLNSQAIPPDSGKDYVSAGYDSGKDALTLTMEQGDIKSRDLILAVSIAPIIVFGILSGGITWIIATRTQQESIVWPLRLSRPTLDWKGNLSLFHMKTTRRTLLHPHTTSC